MTIVDDLLANTGMYIGIDEAPRTDHRGAARVKVKALPGNSGVRLDYEIFNPATPDRLRGHIEHTMIGRTHDGGAIMVIGHDHADSLAILRETEPGRFELGDESAPFPMRVDVSMPEPGTIRHSWWYGMPGETLEERDIAMLKRID
jgi:hypothetical protein